MTVLDVRPPEVDVPWRTVDVGARVALAETIASVAAEVGPLHGVVANAGILPPPTLAAELNWAEWDRVLAVNLSGAVATLVAALPHRHVESGLAAVPLGELVDPDEVAAVVVHLLSDDARSTTGATFSVDGGRTAG